MEFLLIAVVLLGGLGLWLRRRWPKGRGDSDDSGSHFFFMDGGSGGSSGGDSGSSGDSGGGDDGDGGE